MILSKRYIKLVSRSQMFVQFVEHSKLQYVLAIFPGKSVILLFHSPTGILSKNRKMKWKINSETWLYLKSFVLRELRYILYKFFLYTAIIRI